MTQRQANVCVLSFLVVLTLYAVAWMVAFSAGWHTPG